MQSPDKLMEITKANNYISSYIYAPDATAPPGLDSTRTSDVYLSFIQP